MAHIHTNSGDLQIVGVYAQANNDEDPTQPVSSLRAKLWDKIAEAVGPASNILTIMAGCAQTPSLHGTHRSLKSH